MSKYLQFTNETFASRELLIKALAALGFSQVEEGQALPLYGYRGDQRSETAEIVVRRKHIGSASNDIGFHLTTGGYVPIVSQFDARTLRGGQFIPKLRATYHELAVEQLATKHHATLKRTVEGGKVKLRMRF